MAFCLKSVSIGRSHAVAGPGAISTVMVLMGPTKLWWQAVPVLAAIAAYYTVAFGARVQRVLGETGIRILMRLIGLVLSEMVVQFILNGISILKAVARKPVAKVDDQTLILADQAEKAMSQLREGVRELLADKCPQEKGEELARLFSEGTWTHDHPITYEAAKSFGLPVRCDIPAEFLDLMSLYPQPVRRQPTVEYLPGPRRFEGTRGPRD